MRIKKYLVVLLLMIGKTLFAQDSADTTAIIKEMNQVMSFAVQPYLYYSSITVMSTSPLISSPANNNILHSSFYKYGNDLYYGNEQEEMYLQDSLLIKLNHQRKTIELSKVDVASKENLNIVPLSKMGLQKLFRENYSISERPVAGDTVHILIQSKEGKNIQNVTGSDISIEYTRQLHLPTLIEISQHIAQPQSGQVEDVLKRQGFDTPRMVLQRDGVKYLVMTQTVSMQFGSINTTKEKAMQMPLWKEKIAYDDSSKTYTGKGECQGYEVIKTF